MDCIFCRIARGEVPSEMVYQDEQAFAIRDIHPQAPKHLLIIPREHISSLAGVPEERVLLLGHLLSVAKLLAQKGGIAQSGYRVVINSGRDSGQEVPHLHIHLLGGRPLGRLG